MSRLALT
jgi:hypothetical protein